MLIGAPEQVSSLGARIALEFAYDRRALAPEFAHNAGDAHFLKSQGVNLVSFFLAQVLVGHRVLKTGSSQKAHPIAS